MNNFDTFNLRHEAKFKVEIYKNVFWVPTNTFGKSKLSNLDIKNILLFSPEEKRKKITTLYEAIQLFQMGQFQDILDNIEIKENNGRIWEHHKPAYKTIEDNFGCCCSVASWLAYFLKYRYEEVGLLTYMNLNGKGHVFNYIKHNKKYYFIDLYCFTDKTLSSSTIESGNFLDFTHGKFLTGMLIETNSIEDFADYFSRYMILKSKDFLFLKHNEINCCPVNLEFNDDSLLVNLPLNFDISVVNNKRKSNNIFFNRIVGPTANPTWEDTNV